MGVGKKIPVGVGTRQGPDRGEAGEKRPKVLDEYAGQGEREVWRRKKRSG